MGLNLGNKVGIGSNRLGTLLKPFEAEANTYIEAEGITNMTHKKAINQLVVDLKAINEVLPNFVNFSDVSLSNRKAIYPFPGTGALNTRNLLNPANTDAAFRLVFSAAPNISDKGVNFGGDKKADTKLIPVNNLDINDMSMEVALTSAGSNIASSTEMGASAEGNTLMIKANNNTIWYGQIGATALSRIPSITGFLTKVKRNSVNVGGLSLVKDLDIKQNTAVLSGNLPNNSITIGGLNGFSWYSNRTFGFASIGKWMNDAVDYLYYKAIAKYNHALNRFPLNNIVVEGHSFMASSSGIINQISIGLSSNEFQTCGYYLQAVGGSKVFHCVDRIPLLDLAKKSIDGIPIKNIIILWIGTNDVNNNVGSGTTAYNELKSYYQTIINKGWIPVILTMTQKQSGVGQQEAERVIYNNLIKNDLLPTHLIDCDTIPELTDSSNTAYFNADTIHLNTDGYQIAANRIVSYVVDNF